MPPPTPPPCSAPNISLPPMFMLLKMSLPPSQLHLLSLPEKKGFTSPFLPPALDRTGEVGQGVEQVSEGVPVAGLLRSIGEPLLQGRNPGRIPPIGSEHRENLRYVAEEYCHHLRRHVVKAAGTRPQEGQRLTDHRLFGGVLHRRRVEVSAVVMERIVAGWGHFLGRRRCFAAVKEWETSECL